MPRANDGRVLCKDCVCNIDGRCFLNNPLGRTIIEIRFDGEDGMTPGCFQGKPRVARSCNNCAIKTSCVWLYQLESNPMGDWHCSDWEIDDAKAE